MLPALSHRPAAGSKSSALLSSRSGYMWPAPPTTRTFPPLSSTAEWAKRACANAGPVVHVLEVGLKNWLLPSGDPWVPVEPPATSTRPSASVEAVASLRATLMLATLVQVRVEGL